MDQCRRLFAVAGYPAQFGIELLGKPRQRSSSPLVHALKRAVIPSDRALPSDLGLMDSPLCRAQKK